MSKPPLVAVIRDEIAQRGPMPFIRFMEMALYHPEYGYYTSCGEKIGWKGDYYTSSMVHPAFGELIARQLAQMDCILGCKTFTVVEMGAGKGTLCFDIVRFLQKEFSELFNRLQYVIVEKSGWLKARQQEWLGPLFPGRVSWRESVPSQLEGVVFSNELLDAFPVHRLCVGPETFKEIFVDWKQGCFVEALADPSTPRLQQHWREVGVHFDRPVQVEVNLNALHWMKEVGEALHRGFVLTIDYGYPKEALYTPMRARGTFLCYFRHTVNENPYEHIGEQDMTAHVDFTSLAKVGSEAGLCLLGFTDQAYFLMGLGIAQKMEEAANQMALSKEAASDFLAMKQLMDPRRMGRVFKVLIQGKSVPGEIRLNGLQFRPYPDLL